jgi:hypothetical protein
VYFYRTFAESSKKLKQYDDKQALLDKKHGTLFELDLVACLQLIAE